MDNFPPTSRYVRKRQDVDRSLLGLAIGVGPRLELVCVVQLLYRQMEYSRQYLERKLRGVAQRIAFNAQFLKLEFQCIDLEVELAPTRFVLQKHRLVQTRGRLPSDPRNTCRKVVNCAPCRKGGYEYEVAEGSEMVGGGTSEEQCGT